MLENPQNFHARFSINSEERDALWCDGEDRSPRVRCSGIDGSSMVAKNILCRWMLEGNGQGIARTYVSFAFLMDTTTAEIIGWTEHEMIFYRWRDGGCYKRIAVVSSTFYERNLINYNYLRQCFCSLFCGNTIYLLRVDFFRSQFYGNKKIIISYNCFCSRFDGNTQLY